MKNIFFICFCALFAFSGCADDDDDLLTGGNVDIDLLIMQPMLYWNTIEREPMLQIRTYL